MFNVNRFWSILWISECGYEIWIVNGELICDCWYQIDEMHMFSCFYENCRSWFAFINEPCWLRMVMVQFHFSIQFILFDRNRTSVQEVTKSLRAPLIYAMRYTRWPPRSDLIHTCLFWIRYERRYEKNHHALSTIKSMQLHFITILPSWGHAYVIFMVMCFHVHVTSNCVYIFYVNLVILSSFVFLDSSKWTQTHSNWCFDQEALTKCHFHCHCMHSIYFMTNYFVFCRKLKLIRYGIEFIALFHSKWANKRTWFPT